MNKTESYQLKADLEGLPYVAAQLNYIGNVQGYARFDLVEPERTNLPLEAHTVRVHDARPVRDRFTLDTHGFSFIRCPSSVAGSPEIRELNLAHDNLHNTFNNQYNDEIAARLKELTGARDVIPQRSGLIVRTTGGKKKQSWASAATFVHLDYTKSAAQQFCALTLYEAGRPVAPYRRFAIYQTWCAISPAPQDNTLAICDGRTIPAADAVVLENVLGPVGTLGNCFDARLTHYAESHQWYYLSNMELDDLLVFKGFDSDDPDAMNAMHTAFINPNAGPDAVPRESIEARFFAFFD